MLEIMSSNKIKSPLISDYYQLTSPNFFHLLKPISSWMFVCLLILIHITSHLPYPVHASLTDNNFPPRFASSSSSSPSSPNGGSGSEIVVRVKEGPSSLNKEIYRLVGEDPDGDPLTFGVLGSIGEDILRIENEKPNQAVIYLRKELDRETRDSYSLVLTLTDGKLGKGNFVSSYYKSCSIIFII